MQILEHFDDAPDDSANWGKAISSLDEVKDSSDDYESHNTDSDVDQNEFENDSNKLTDAKDARSKKFAIPSRRVSNASAFNFHIICKNISKIRYLTSK